MVEKLRDDNKIRLELKNVLSLKQPTKSIQKLQSRLEFFGGFLKLLCYNLTKWTKTQTILLLPLHKVVIILTSLSQTPTLPSLRGKI